MVKLSQYTTPKDGTASGMIWDAALGGKGPWVHCSCGLDHSVSDEEYEESNCGFKYIELDGQTFVYDCEGCSKKLRRYEDFIWKNRNTIRRYLRIRVNQEKAWADQEKMLNDIAGIT